MAEENKQGSDVDDLGAAQLRHTVKSSKLLYSAPDIVLRAPIYLIFTIAFTALLYSFWAKKDELVVAPLTLKREAVTIQAVGAGIVTYVMTEENARIASGDPIAVVQEQIRAAASPEQQALYAEKQELEKELDKALKDYDHQISQLHLDLDDLRRNNSSNKGALQSRIQTIRLQLDAAKRASESVERKLALARKRLGTKEKLYLARDLTITEYEEAQESVSDLERSSHDSQSEIQKIRLTLQTTRDELRIVQNLHREEKIVRDIQKQEKNQARDVKDLKERIDSTVNRIKGVDTMVRGVSYDENTALYKSNFDGLVTGSHIKNGQLIAGGAPVATIVKQSAPLEAHVLVQNQDIGRLKHGQEVKIKYFAYPYQDYGVQKGTIVDIAIKSGGQDAPEGTYVVRAALHQETISKPGGKVKNLEIGLAGSAEIITGDKRLIELVFSPVSRFFTKPED